MGRSYRAVDRDQLFLMPPSLREWLPPEHLVWFVVAVVDQMDTSAFHARHPVSGPGRRAYDPDMLLALLTYSYAVGELSSRQIERLCGEHIAFRVLCAQDAPDHSTISRFRAVHEDLFAGFFTQVLMLCAKAGMGHLTRVAIDGTKIAANASTGANRSMEKLQAEADRIIAEAAAVDRAEDAQEDAAGGPPQGPAPEFIDPRSRAAHIQAAINELQREHGKDLAKAQQVADRRAEKWAARIQSATAKLAEAEAKTAARRDAWEKAVETARAHGTAGPSGPAPATVQQYVVLQRLRDQLANLHTRLAKAKQPQCKNSRASMTANVTDPQSRLLPARGGFVQGYNAQLAVSDDHLILATSLSQDPHDHASFELMMNAAVQAAATIGQHQPAPHPTCPGASQPPGTIGLILADAGYYSEHNLNIPGPDRLIALGKQWKLLADATTDPVTGPPPPGASPVEQMKHRLRTPEGVADYKRRKATVEPVNGHLKDRIRLRRFSRTGHPAAQSELTFAAAVLNLLKLHRHTTQPAC